MSGISVVIPTYNRADLIPKAIESVLSQTCPVEEVIVVDDGSTDDTPQVLAGYSGRIRVVRQENAGQSAARNAGIAAAKAEWIAFLDDDDEYAPNRVAVALESIGRHPAAEIHITNTAVIIPGARAVNLFEARNVVATELMELQRPLPWVLHGCFFVQAMVARRDTLQDVGLFRGTFYEDLDIFVRLSTRKPWVVDSRPLLRLIRRENASALSDECRSRPLVRCEALVQIHREALALPGLADSEISQARNGLATWLFELGAALTERGNSRLAKRYFAEAAKSFERRHSRIKAKIALWGGAPFICILKRLTENRRKFVR